MCAKEEEVTAKAVISSMSCDIIITSCIEKKGRVQEKERGIQHFLCDSLFLQEEQDQNKPKNHCVFWSRSSSVPSSCSLSCFFLPIFSPPSLPSGAFFFVGNPINH